MNKKALALSLVYGRVFLITSIMFALNAVCLISTANAQDITGSGIIVSQERIVDAFTGIQFETVGDVFVVQDTVHRLLIEADDNIIDLLTTEVNEGLLTISLESGFTIDDSNISVYASMVDIERLEITGVGNIESTEPISANDILCRISGVGDIVLSGTVANQTVEITGNGNVRNFELSSTNSSVTITGVGNCEVNVSGNLDVVINGVGNVVYIGNPSTVNAETNGIGTVMPGTPDDNNIEWVEINGMVTYEEEPLCAMVLANGQYLFTCGDSLGLWNLEVPLDENGEITLYGFCSGFSPSKTILTPEEALDFDILMTRAAAGSQEIELTVQTEPGTDNPDYVRVSGTVTYYGQDLCAMVLANGQNMFSCGDDLGTFDLEVPLDGNGAITLYVFVSGFAPYKEVFVSNESIIGTWNWYETSGGIGGIIETPQTTGETRKVVFQENANVTFYTNDEVTLSSTYTLANEITIISEEPLPIVKVEGLDNSYIYSFPYVDELKLQENVIDGFIHNYTKE